MIRGIQHCALVVADVERSRRFYTDVIGLVEIERPSSFRFAGAWFRAGEDELHLIGGSETTMAAGGKETGVGISVGLVTHVALEVDDLAAALERVRTAGVEIGGGPMPRGDGVDQAFLLDPDGFVVELFERTGADQSASGLREPVRA
jgi:catechol 2,3-dioxygenase-like lactoylglutathione lyase family enzyme